MKWFGFIVLIGLCFCFNFIWHLIARIYTYEHSKSRLRGIRSSRMESIEFIQSLDFDNKIEYEHTENGVYVECGFM